MKTYIYKKIGSLEIKADVYTPTTTNNPRPVIIWIHGGALISGDRKSVRADQNNIYLAQGYIVVSIEYRLAPETKLPEILQDLIDAFAWVRTQGPTLFNADPNRIAAVGHSAGGYLALMAGVHVKPRIQAIASLYGYGDIVGQWYSKPDPFYLTKPLIDKQSALAAIKDHQIAGVPFGQPRSDYYLYLRQQGLWPNAITGFDPHAQPQAFKPYCPDQKVSKEYPPTILIHGDEDTDVPYHLSQTMAAKLDAHNVEHQFITIPDGPHGFDVVGEGLNQPAVSDAFQGLIGFLQKHLQ